MHDLAELPFIRLLHDRAEQMELLDRLLTLQQDYQERMQIDQRTCKSINRFLRNGLIEPARRDEYAAVLADRQRRIREDGQRMGQLRKRIALVRREIDRIDTKLDSMQMQMEAERLEAEYGYALYAGMMGQSP